jgi:hypothetical protein
MTDPRRQPATVRRAPREGSSPRAAGPRTARPARPLPLSPALRAQQAARLGRRIAAHIRGASVEVTITNNRAVMISVKRDQARRRYKVRLHHLFIGAPDAVLEDMARYVELNDRQASRQLGDFIEANSRAILPRQPRVMRPAPLRVRGRYYHLQEIFDELNEVYFGGRIACQITWGRNVLRGRERSSVKVGSFEVEENLIRIHPGLDQGWVPDYYVRWVIYHEMLHVAHPIPVVNGRHRFHTPEFSRDERKFTEYDRATAWEKRNIANLLRI